MISEEEFMDIRALSREGLSYAEIGRVVGRDWRTIKRYLEEGAQPAYRRRRVPSRTCSEVSERECACEPGVDLGHQPVRQGADVLFDGVSVDCGDLCDVDHRVAVEAGEDVGRHQDVAGQRGELDTMEL